MIAPGTQLGRQPGIGVAFSTGDADVRLGVDGEGIDDVAGPAQALTSNATVSSTPRMGPARLHIAMEPSTLRSA